MPVIFLTARDDIEYLRIGFRQGGDDYLTKPFSLEELGLRIEALLRRSRPVSESSRLVVGDLVLDEDAHQVWKDEDEITLSPTEFRLLRFLLINRGRVLSKAQIVDYVWEYDFDGNYGIVETYVSYLRKKLDDAEGKLIQTVRGIGYVIRQGS
jgi:two-component system OmpR family response regulator